jgi:L-2,4-diaminobutyrate decarboxylase
VPAELTDAPGDVLGRFQLELRRDIVRSGAFYLVPTTKDGIAALRCTIINPLTTPGDLADLLDELQSRGKTVLQKMR